VAASWLHQPRLDQPKAQPGFISHFRELMAAGLA
jgi:hypothetical protein